MALNALSSLRVHAKLSVTALVVWCDTITVKVCSSFGVELQNASLTVLSDGSTRSLTSSDSLWGQEMTDPATGYQTDRRSSHGLSPHEASLETWLMLEYCDKGSLLVGTPPTSSH